MFGFPNPVNEKAARVVAGVVALTGVLILLTGGLVVDTTFSKLNLSPSRLNRATVLDPLLTAATNSPPYCFTPRAFPPAPPLPCVDRV